MPVHSLSHSRMHVTTNNPEYLQLSHQASVFTIAWLCSENNIEQVPSDRRCSSLVPTHEVARFAVAGQLLHNVFSVVHKSPRDIDFGDFFSRNLAVGPSSCTCPHAKEINAWGEGILSWKILQHRVFRRFIEIYYGFGEVFTLERYLLTSCVRKFFSLAD